MVKPSVIAFGKSTLNVHNYNKNSKILKFRTSGCKGRNLVSSTVVLLFRSLYLQKLSTLDLRLCSMSSFNCCLIIPAFTGVLEVYLWLLAYKFESLQNRYRFFSKGKKHYALPGPYLFQKLSRAQKKVFLVYHRAKLN